MQPRISPRDDALLYCGLNDNTGKREIYHVSLTDKSSVPENITNTPDDDEYDAAWSKDGNKIAYSLERGGAVDKNNLTAGNPSIWVFDLKSNEKPIEITANGSVDDHPVWDPTGNFIYFRLQSRRPMGYLENCGTVSGRACVSKHFGQGRNAQVLRT